MADIKNPEVPGRPPTCDEASENAVVDGCMAAWYPQMGGYGALCWVRFGCYDGDPPTSIPGFDVVVWHDGEWPFSGDDELGREPAHLHHCSADQFIEFGELCNEFLGSLVMRDGSESGMKDRVARAIAASSSHGMVHMGNPAVKAMLEVLRGEE